VSLRELVMGHPGCRTDEVSLRKVQDLCRTALSVTNDGACVEIIGKLEDLAHDLLSEEGHYKWERPGMLGVAALKLEILKTLVAFRGRVATMEAEHVPSSMRSAQTADRPADRS
jgi:hypothetical protein